MQLVIHALKTCKRFIPLILACLLINFNPCSVNSLYRNEHQTKPCCKINIYLVATGFVFHSINNIPFLPSIYQPIDINYFIYLFRVFYKSILHYLNTFISEYILNLTWSAWYIYQIQQSLIVYQICTDI